MMRLQFQWGLSSFLIVHRPFWLCRLPSCTSVLPNVVVHHSYSPSSWKAAQTFHKDQRRGPTSLSSKQLTPHQRAKMSKREGRCGTCHDRLTKRDFQKTTGQYWVNCKTCRDKHNAAKRKRRAHKAFDRSFIDNRSYFDDSSEYDGWDSEFDSDPDGNSRKSNAPVSAIQSPPEPSSRPPINKSRPILTPVSRTNRGGQEGSIRTSTSVRECSGCSTTYPAQDFPSLMSCAHTPEFCRGCFLRWLETRMREVEQVQCPSSGRTNTITHGDVQRYAPHNLYIRFDQLLATRLLRSDPDFVHCIAEGCSSGQIHVNSLEGSIFYCVACHFRMCTAHNPPVPFHENESCEQYTKRIAREARNDNTESRRIHKKQNEASVALLKRVTVRCRQCKARIQKSEGCDHMTCQNKGCGYEFCYVCRAPYRGRDGIMASGDHAHRRSCPYYRSNQELP